MHLITLSLHPSSKMKVSPAAARCLPVFLATLWGSVVADNTCSPYNHGLFFAPYSTPEECNAAASVEAGAPAVCSTAYIYTKEECEYFATALGFTVGNPVNNPSQPTAEFSGPYDNKGCYIYNEVSATNEGFVYFGEGSPEEYEWPPLQTEPWADNVERLLKPTPIIYTWQECEYVAIALGLKLGGSPEAPQTKDGTPFNGNFENKGCYVYNEIGGENEGFVYFGNGTPEEMNSALATSLDRLVKPALALPCPTCNGQDWCVEFQSVTSTLDGDTTTSDVALTFASSDPAKDAATGEDTKFYKISLLDSATCLTPIPGTAGVTAIYEEVKADAAEGFKNGQLTFGLDIDTTKIETYDGNGVAFELDPPVANQFQAKFCAKVDLYSKVGAEVYKSETSETNLVLTFDKTKNFEFSITAEKEGRGSRTTDVYIDHDLISCVCDDAEKCYGSPSSPGPDGTTDNPLTGPLTPGAFFKFCVKDGSSSASGVTLDSVKGVAFKNTQDSDLSIPIVNSTGFGVGPSSGKVTCTAGSCVIEARSYARMYEKVETDGSVTDISTGSKIDGTAVLKFARRRLVRGSIVQETESVEVNFGGRALQEDGTTPVNDFEVDMNLATPPDRSSATASSAAMAFASLMMAGLVGVVTL